MKNYMKKRRSSEEYKRSGEAEKTNQRQKEYERKKYHTMDEASKEELLNKIRDYKFDKRHNCTLEQHLEMCKKDKFRKMSKLAEMTEEEKEKKRKYDVRRQTELYNYKISVSDESRYWARFMTIAYEVRQDSKKARRVIWRDNLKYLEELRIKFVKAQSYNIIPQYWHFRDDNAGCLPFLTYLERNNYFCLEFKGSIIDKIV